MVARGTVEDGEGFCIFLVRDFGYKGEVVMFDPEEGVYDRKEQGEDQVGVDYVLNTENRKAD